MISTSTFAQSAAEKTGVNSTLGISPTTADFVKEAGDDPKLKDWAGKTLPALKHHLEMVQDLRKMD